MAPFTNVNTREVSRDMRSASSRPTSNGEAGPRVVKNKAKKLATQGSAPWDDDQRQQLVDCHTSLKNWEEVAKVLKRSNQAIRLEWKKMRDGNRDQGKQGHWQQKVKACEKQRETIFSSKGSKARRTAATAPAVGRPTKDSSTTPRSIASTSRSPAADTSSNTALSRSPGLDTDMTGIDQTDTGDEDVIAEAMRYQSLGSVSRGIEPHESRMLFREEAWTRSRRGRVAYLHPWGFKGRYRGRGQWFPDVDLNQPDQISESCTRLSRREIDADLREMGIGL